MIENALAVILAQQGVVKLLETVQYYGSPFVESLKVALVARANRYAAIQDARGKVEVAQQKALESRMKAESKIEIDRIKADAKALTIATPSEDGLAILSPAMKAEIEAVLQRTQSRVVVEEVRRQINMESIAVQAAEEMPKTISGKPVDPDWTSSFFESAKDVSDEEMQRLWARVLADEVAQPGSFKKRTLDLLKVLTKREADLFSRLCRFAWDQGNFVYFWNIEDEFFKGNGWSFDNFLELETTGLIRLQLMPQWNWQATGVLLVHYFGSFVRLINKESLADDGSITVESLKDKHVKLRTGPLMFSAAGKELFRIVKAQPDPEYFKLALQKIVELNKDLHMEVLSQQSTTSQI